MYNSNTLLLIMSIVAIFVVLGGAVAYSYINKDNIPGFAPSRQDRYILNGWNFIILGHEGIDIQEFQRSLKDNGINATVSEYNEGMLSANRPRAHSVVIVDLIDKSVYSSINSPSMLNVLRDLSMRGVYVLFLSNNASTLRSIAGAFNPPLPITTISTVTITKQYKNNNTETITENILTIVGRAYRNIEGRMVPEDITITVHYKSPSNLDNAIQKALDSIPGQITSLELKLNNSIGR